VSRMKDRSRREMFPALSVASRCSAWVPSASAQPASVCNSGGANVNEPSERSAEASNLDLGRRIGCAGSLRLGTPLHSTCFVFALVPKFKS